MVPAGIAGWWLTLFFILLLYGLVNLACPPDAIVDGTCTAAWHEPLMNEIFISSGGFCALFSIGLAVLMAPDHKIEVAVITLVCIIVYIGYYLVAPQPLAGLAIAAMITSIVVGMLAVVIIIKVLKSKPSS